MTTSGYISEERLRKLFLDLVYINSPSRGEKDLAGFVQTHLLEIGLEVTQGEPIAGGNCGNVLGILPGQGRQKILLAAHLDTVESTEGILCIEEDGVIRTDGRTILGADDKAGIAAILEAVRTVVEQNLPHPTVYTLFTVGEEVGLLGIKSCQSLPPIDFGYVIDSDGLPGTIVNGAPYHYDLRAVIHGKAAHAGVAPERGINAIVVAAAVIQQIEFGRIGPDTTSNIGVIQGGKARNIVPDRVELTGEVRSLDEEKAQAQLSRIREVLTTTTTEYGAKFCFDVEKAYGGYRVLPDHPGVSIAKQAAERIGITPTIKQSGGGTDANILNELGITTVPLGIAAQGEHTKEEQIRVADLIKVAEHLTEIMILSAG